MGRWGWRLFEGDQDLDAACCLAESLGIQTDDWEHSMSSMVHQTDMLADEGTRAFYRTEEYKSELENEIVPYVRANFDTDNFGDRTIILGALMMRAGAKIRAQDLQHLRDLVPQIHCSSRFALPLGDEGFRTPGRAQFLAALDHYQAGVPRNYLEPRQDLLFRYGLCVRSDIGHGLVLCTRCSVAYYCDGECERHHWQEHKASCVRPEERRSRNV
ncbi:hypothetical protein AFLA70_206g001620 [Aspergillus flavus AF70]|nr:hypothetical protein AFLA70_206g001620 [Aspergillus flavus AF70]